MRESIPAPAGVVEKIPQRSPERPSSCRAAPKRVTRRRRQEARTPPALFVASGCRVLGICYGEH